jgi:hypothetical protein
MSGPGRARETSYETPGTRQTPSSESASRPRLSHRSAMLPHSLHGAEAPPIPLAPQLSEVAGASVQACASEREDPVRARCTALCLLAHGSGLWVLGLIGMRWFAGRPGIAAATARRSSVRVSRLDPALRPGDRRGRRSLSLCGRRALYRTASWVSPRFGGQRGRCRLSLSRCCRWIRNITGGRGGTQRVNRSGIDGQGGLRLTPVECRRIQSTQSGKGNVRSQCEGDRCAEGNSKHHNGPAHPHQDGPASPGLVVEDGLGHRHGLTVPRNCPRPDTRPKSC